MGTGRYYYPDNSGRYVVDAWWRDGDKYYCFDTAGYMMTGAWTEYKGAAAIWGMWSDADRSAALGRQVVLF